MDFAQLRTATAPVDEHGPTVDGVGSSRRRFLTRAGTAVVAGTAALPFVARVAGAQTSDTAPDAAAATTGASGGLGAESPTTTAAPKAGDGCTADPVVLSDADLAIVVFHESLELAAAQIYKIAVASGRLSPQQQENASTFGRHHAAHAEALYCLAGTQAPGGVRGTADQSVVDDIQPKIAAALDATAVIQPLYELEEALAATNTAALANLESRQAAGAVASILPVDGQQAVVWGQDLGLPIQDWMPNFQSETGAFAPAAS